MALQIRKDLQDQEEAMSLDTVVNKGRKYLANQQQFARHSGARTESTPRETRATSFGEKGGPLRNRTMSFTTGMTAKEPFRVAQGRGQQGDFRGRTGSWTPSSTSQNVGGSMGTVGVGLPPRRECSYCLLPSHTWVTCKLNSAGPNFDASWKPPYRMKGKPFPPPLSIEQNKKIEAIAAHVQQDPSIDEITVQDEAQQEELIARATQQTQEPLEERMSSPDFTHRFTHCRINTCQMSPIIQATIGTVSVTALIDTGSPRSVISTETWRHIRDKARREGRRSILGSTKQYKGEQ